MKKVFYLSPVVFLVSMNVFSASVNDYSEINTTNTTLPTIEATAVHSIAIGPESSVNQNDAYASASKSKKGRYSGVYSIAEGYKATVYGSQSIAYGHESVANGWLSYAIGSRANAEGDGNIALGGSAKSLAGVYYGNPSSGGAIAMGLESSTIGNGAIAVGNKAQASGVKSIAIGNDARTLDITNTDGAENIAPNVKSNIKTTVETLRKQNSPIDMTAELIGLSDEATSTIAIGDESRAIGWGSTALGTKAYALNDRATTLGDDSKTLGYAGTSVGTHAYSFGKGASALGTWAEALGDYSTAAGPSSSAAGNNSIAMGNGAAASGLNAIAIGSMTTKTKAWYTTGGGKQVHRSEHDVWNAVGDHSIALGTDSQATENSSIAMGKEAFANHERSVALGDKSTTEDAKNTSQATVNGITYGDFAGKTSVGTVSVGNSKLGETRQIKNVSAGDISPTSTDAVNGSQLYLIASKLTEEIKNIKPNPTPVPPPMNVDTGDISVNDNGIAVADSTKSNLANVTDVANAINNSSFNITTGSEDGGKAISTTTEKVRAGNTVTYKAGKNMVVKQSGKNITYSTTDNPNFDVVNANEFRAGDVVINQQGINAGNKKITNVAEGTNDTDAVNYAQLKRTNNQVRQLENKLNRVDRKLRGGIAQAGAMANIPQVTRNGASGVGVGVASYRDENAISVGYSRMSDNGKHIIKTSVGLDTQGYNMVGAGYMYQW